MTEVTNFQVTARRSSGILWEEMLANANPRVGTAPRSRSAREVVAICATHDIPYGSRECLAGFMRALHENKHLAMEFWSLVSRRTRERPVQDSEPKWIF